MRALAIAALAVVLLGGCSGDDPTLPAGNASPPPSEEPAPFASSSVADTSAEALSAETCQLITAAEASAALGEVVEASPGDLGACYYSIGGPGEVGVLVPEEDLGDFKKEVRENREAIEGNPTVELRVFEDIGQGAYATYNEASGTRFFIGYVRAAGRFTSVTFFPPDDVTTDSGWVTFEGLLEGVAERL